MKYRLIAPLAAALLSTAAMAQTAQNPSTPPASPTPAPAPTTPPFGAPAPSEPSTTGTAAPRQDENAPLRGANSFTETQAKARMEQHGFTSIGSLQKDENGVWRGSAMKDGKNVTVMLDYRGNVVSQ